MDNNTKEPQEIKNKVEGVAAILEMMAYGVDNMRVRSDLQESFLLLAENLYFAAEELEALQDRFDNEIIKAENKEEQEG